jgi:hypothetical protein
MPISMNSRFFQVSAIAKALHQLLSRPRIIPLRVERASSRAGARAALGKGTEEPHFEQQEDRPIGTPIPTQMRRHDAELALDSHERPVM